jgi:propionyl-CoA carboxylase alpha chain
MIAKLVTHAPDRAGAIAAQAEALDRFVIDGIRHNIPFLSSLMRSPRWREGRLSTRFIAEEYGATFAAPEPSGAMARVFVAVALAIDATLGRRRRALSGRIRAQTADIYERERGVFLGKTRLDVSVAQDDGGLTILFPDHDRPVRVDSGWKPSEKVWAGRIDGESVAMTARAVLNGYHLSHAGFAARTSVLTRRQADLALLMLERAEADTSKALLCPMPGLVKVIHVVAGQKVKAGEPLCLVEAMKMENVLKAERDVTIKTIEAKPGESLAVDAPIMTFA